MVLNQLMLREQACVLTISCNLSKYHLRCVKKVLSEKELEQLLAIIRSLDVDPDVGSRSAMIRQIDGDSKKTAWEYVFEND